jgi:hypothetical protein
MVEKVVKEIRAFCPFVGLDSTLILSSFCKAGGGSPMLAEGRAGTKADPYSDPTFLQDPDRHQSF